MVVDERPKKLEGACVSSAGFRPLSQPAANVAHPTIGPGQGIPLWRRVARLEARLLQGHPHDAIGVHHPTEFHVRSR